MWGLEVEQCGESVLVKADDHLIINHQGGDTLRPELSQFYAGRAVQAHVLFGEGDVMTRKKLFRHVAPGSGGGGVDHHVGHRNTSFLTTLEQGRAVLAGRRLGDDRKQRGFDVVRDLDQLLVLDQADQGRGPQEADVGHPTLGVDDHLAGQEVAD